MRIAVTYENGQVFQHFGHTEEFKIYEIEDGKVVDAKILSTDGIGHGALAQVLQRLRVEILICGGIGGGARNALAEAGVDLLPGVSGLADDAVDAYLAGNLDFDPDTTCSHHDHEEGHSCGSHSHSCGSHSHSCGSHGCH